MEPLFPAGHILQLSTGTINKLRNSISLKMGKLSRMISYQADRHVIWTDAIFLHATACGKLLLGTFWDRNGFETAPSRFEIQETKNFTLNMDFNVEPIRVAVVGVGNCASSLVQGIQFYRNKTAADSVGLMHWHIGGYKPFDISAVAAFDIDMRKVGRELSEAALAPPNCTMRLCDNVPSTGVKVRMGRVLDGISDHMCDYHESLTFVKSDEPEPEKEEIVPDTPRCRSTDPINVFAGRIGRSNSILRGVRSRSRLGSHQQHTRVYRQRSDMGKTLC